MRTVLKDPALEKQFQEEGYVCIPFLSPAEVSDLKQKFLELVATSGGNITSSENGFEGNEITYDFTFIDKNIAYKQAVFDEITTAFKPHVDKWLDRYKPVIANYIRKKTDTGEVPLHQNWAFADEHKCCTVSIWCPLIDSVRNNGTLQVVPKSHKRFGEVRGPMIPWELEGIGQEIIDHYLIPVDTKAGDAVILDDSIVHYSAPNATKELRIAIQLILIPEEFPSIHYHVNPAVDKELVQVLEVDADFYMKFNPWMQPENANVINSFRHVSKPLTVPEFEKALHGKRFDEEEKAGLFSKLRRLITQ